jgi:hypothetical protein
MLIKSQNILTAEDAEGAEKMKNGIAISPFFPEIVRVFIIFLVNNVDFHQFQDKLCVPQKLQRHCSF